MNSTPTLRHCTPGHFPSLIGEPEASGRQLPLRSTHITVEPGSTVARVQIVSTFLNSEAEAVDVVWTQPRHPQMAIIGIGATVDGLELTGHLSLSDDALDEFNEATTNGEAALLAEAPSPGRLRIRLGNVPGNGTAEVRIEVVTPWIAEGDDAVVRLPLVMGRRYAEVLHAPLMTTPDYTTAVTYICAAAPKANTTFIPSGDGNWTTPPGWIPEGDMILYRERIQSPVAVWSADSAGSGGAVSVLAPTSSVGAGAAPTTSVGRDVVILLDTSGSMGSWKLAEAARATTTILGALDPRDRFDIATFDSDFTWGFGEMVAADNANLAWITNELSLISASGGTNMDLALAQAGARLGSLSDDREQLLLVVTDAQFGDVDALRNRVPSNVRVCAVGVDAAVNEEALAALCTADGSYEVVGSPGEIRWAAQRIISLVSEPVVHALTIDEAAWADVVPVIPGRMIVLGAAFESRPETVRLSGFDVTGAEIAFEVPVAVGQGADTNASAAVALRRVDQLVSFDAGGASTATERGAVAMAAGVLSDRTSWVLRSGDVAVGEVSGRVIVQPHLATRRFRTVGATPPPPGRGGRGPQRRKRSRSMPEAGESASLAPVAASAPAAQAAPLAARGGSAARVFSKQKRTPGQPPEETIEAQLRAAIVDLDLKQLRSVLARVAAAPETERVWVRRITAALVRSDITEDALASLALEWLDNKAS